MFLKTAELKKLMKDRLKASGLIVGYIGNHYLVYSDCWGLYVDDLYASNKFKAAIMELIGDLPEREECYCYRIVDKEISQERVLDYLDPFLRWKEAKDPVVITPIKLLAWPHEYIVVQRRSDLAFLMVKTAWTTGVISSKELTVDECMPERPSLLGETLYFKNESGIWWVAAEQASRKAKEVLFPHLSGINFFESEWLDKPEDMETAEEAEGEALPY